MINPKNKKMIFLISKTLMYRRLLQVSRMLGKRKRNLKPKLKSRLK